MTLLFPQHDKFDSVVQIHHFAGVDQGTDNLIKISAPGEHNITNLIYYSNSLADKNPLLRLLTIYYHYASELVNTMP